MRTCGIYIDLFDVHIVLIQLFTLCSKYMLLAYSRNISHMRRRRDRSSSGDDDDLLPDWGDAGLREHKKSGRHRRLVQDMYRMALLLTLVQSLLVPYNAVYNSHRPSLTTQSIHKDDL